jgi:hypothetical protein
MSGHVERQVALISQASEMLADKDIAPYFKLRTLLTRQDKKNRTAFKKTFARFYGLNSAGLTDSFKKRYFELLFELDLAQYSTPPYESLLKDLYRIKRRQGDHALAASFVSKMVAIHDDSRPLYDRHVSGFFGITVPTNGSRDFRIAGFVANLDHIRHQYQNWCKTEQVKGLIASLQSRTPQLANCHPIRICDFLVWTVGRHQIGKPKK